MKPRVSHLPLLITLAAGLGVGSAVTAATGWTVIATGSSAGTGFVNAQAEANLGRYSPPVALRSPNKADISWSIVCNGAAALYQPNDIIPISQQAATSCAVTASASSLSGGALRVQILKRN